jgi:AcrR family transcriptional regulator
MSPRLTRAEQTQRNRELVLAAAREVFMARGYHSATLEQIADAAGFSKGVVYSQFRSKADLFMALLEARIDERAEENARLVEGLSGDQGVAAVVERGARLGRAEPEWGLLVIEFRVHAARDPELNRRYGAAHARTVRHAAALFTTLYERAGTEPRFAAEEMAELMLVISSGVTLEHSANPDALHGPLAAEVLTRVLAGREPARGASRGKAA